MDIYHLSDKYIIVKTLILWAFQVVMKHNMYYLACRLYMQAD